MDDALVILLTLAVVFIVIPVAIIIWAVCARSSQISEEEGRRDFGEF